MFEYKVIDLSIVINITKMQEQLNLMAENNWHVICMNNKYIIFEREKSPEITQTQDEKGKHITYTWS